MNTQAFMAVLRRDLLLAMRRKSEVLTAVFFFVVVAALFPLGIGPELNTLRLVAPGVLWVGALLSSMLALQRLFEADYRDGTLEQMALSPASMPLLVGAKMLAHWLVAGVPLVLLAPVLGLQFDLSADALLTLTLALLMGTPILSLVGGIGAALTLGVRGGGVLLSLLGAAFVCASAGVWCWRCGSPSQRVGSTGTFFYSDGHVVACGVFQPVGLFGCFAHCAGMTGL